MALISHRISPRKLVGGEGFIQRQHLHLKHQRSGWGDHRGYTLDFHPYSMRKSQISRGSATFQRSSLCLRFYSPNKAPYSPPSKKLPIVLIEAKRAYSREERRGNGLLQHDKRGGSNTRRKLGNHCVSIR